VAADLILNSMDCWVDAAAQLNSMLDGFGIGWSRGCVKRSNELLFPDEDFVYLP
jgi:hypothetical protein